MERTGLCMRCHKEGVPYTPHTRVTLNEDDGCYSEFYALMPVCDDCADAFEEDNDQIKYDWMVCNLPILEGRYKALEQKLKDTKEFIAKFEKEHPEVV